MTETKLTRRMNFREHSRRFLFYPEDAMKENWDLIVSVALIFTCSQTPFNIAFQSNEVLPIGIRVINYLIDVIFFMDIMVIFNSAFYDIEFDIVEDYSIIFVNYVKGWFLLDFLAVFPFE